MLRQNNQECRHTSQFKGLFALKYKPSCGDEANDIIIEF